MQPMQRNAALQELSKLRLRRLKFRSADPEYIILTVYNIRSIIGTHKWVVRSSYVFMITAIEAVSTHFAFRCPICHSRPPRLNIGGDVAGQTRRGLQANKPARPRISLSWPSIDTDKQHAPDELLSHQRSPAIRLHQNHGQPQWRLLYVRASVPTRPVPLTVPHPRPGTACAVGPGRSAPASTSAPARPAAR